MFFLSLYEAMYGSPQTACACKSFCKARLYSPLQFANEMSNTHRFAIITVHILCTKYPELTLHFPFPRVSVIRLTNIDQHSNRCILLSQKWILSRLKIRYCSFFVIFLSIYTHNKPLSLEELHSDLKMYSLHLHCVFFSHADLHFAQKTYYYTTDS